MMEIEKKIVKRYQPKIQEKSICMGYPSQHDHYVYLQDIYQRNNLVDSISHKEIKETYILLKKHGIRYRQSKVTLVGYSLWILLNTIWRKKENWRRRRRRRRTKIHNNKLPVDAVLLSTKKIKEGTNHRGSKNTYDEGIYFLLVINTIPQDIQQGSAENHGNSKRVWCL